MYFLLILSAAENCRQIFTMKTNKNRGREDWGGQAEAFLAITA
jgi:hypothetical protein